MGDSVSFQRSPDDSDSDSDLNSLFGEISDLVTLDDERLRSTTSTSREAVLVQQTDPVYGLQWTNGNGNFSLTPRWTVEPTIGAIILTLRNVIDLHKRYTVEHLWDGTFNKIYSVSYDQTHLIMRISLPVCPRTKTESEAATIQSYDSSRDNPIGFEWILMDRIDGIPLSQCWSSVTQDAKERIVKQIARYAATAFRAQFKGVGNLYPPRSYSSGSQPRVADLRLKTLEISDKGHREIATRMIILINHLRGIEDKFFPTPEIGSNENLVCDDDESIDKDEDEDDEDVVDKGERPDEPTMLWHDNISLDNILVDKNGILCGVIGWECVSCLPLYEACQFPAFLQQPQDRPVEPSTPFRVTRKQPNNDREIASYDRKLRQHHITLLRRSFITEMLHLCPEWVAIFDGRRYLRDYEAAVQNCDNESAYEIVEKWVDAVERVENSDRTPWPLHERLMG
ncbi:kinase-like protein [Annulohypoxylon maeteangense]|uniref:kinase-like protein n=1 Tax=Annulohypoxylon maeteangense TaxID=1927788 RepID=UPI002008183D|nr:kinase-like protein [Annulohypoxylon maeteangense]KAI0880515.1 kinase-like protein [Annulohypoxylon maeteangense]